ncbi:hypothetical protein ACAG26_18835 [Mycobacterium sp. pUA109]|uniref:hypothetical protein n=1 Tax=Mycobacterium sp. pUA109 TaxID=3238982 RepID=UPI00351BA19E
MHTTLRPYVTAGVALVGASVIAATPFAAPLPDIQQRAVELTADADGLIADAQDVFGGAFDALTGGSGAELSTLALSDTVPLFTSWVDVFSSAFNNLGELGQSVLDNPAPILEQLATNWLGYGQTYAGAIQTAAENLAQMLDPSYAYGLWGQLQTAFTDLTSGQFQDAVQTAYSGITQTLIAPGFALLPTLQIPGDIAHNVYNVAQLIPQLAMGLGLGVLQPLSASIYGAFATSGQAVVDAISDADALGALTALGNVPTAVVGGLLSGFGYSTGILQDPGGPIALILQMRELVADAIGGGAAAQGLAEGPLNALVSAPMETLGSMFNADGLADLGALLDPGQFLSGMSELFDPTQLLAEVAQLPLLLLGLG